MKNRFLLLIISLVCIFMTACNIEGESVSSPSVLASSMPSVAESEEQSLSSSTIAEQDASLEAASSEEQLSPSSSEETSSKVIENIEESDAEKDSESIYKEEPGLPEDEDIKIEKNSDYLLREVPLIINIVDTNGNAIEDLIVETRYPISVEPQYTEYAEGITDKFGNATMHDISNYVGRFFVGVEVNVVVKNRYIYSEEIVEDEDLQHYDYLSESFDIVVPSDDVESVSLVWSSEKPEESIANHENKLILRYVDENGKPLEEIWGYLSAKNGIESDGEKQAYIAQPSIIAEYQATVASNSKGEVTIVGIEAGSYSLSVTTFQTNVTTGEVYDTTVHEFEYHNDGTQIEEIVMKPKK